MSPRRRSARRRACTAVITAFSWATGPDAIGELFRVPRLHGALSAATWSEPRRDGTTVTVDATFPPGRPLTAITTTIALDDDERLASVVEIVPAPPPSRSR